MTKGSVEDWAAKTAHVICDAISEDFTVSFPTLVLSEHRIAAIIATFAEPLVRLLQESQNRHERGYLRCPMADGDEDGLGYPCTCGADDWNRRVDEALDG